VQYGRRMWRELAREQGYETFQPAAGEALRAVEVGLGCTLPDSLRDLLSETDMDED
jgi:cell wall assembly regulator SMI1